MKLLKRLTTLPLIGLIQLYRFCISPFTNSSCRFQPTCSAYAKEAFEKHGLVHGAVLAIKRMKKCHPWGDEGFDPVPEKQ